MNSHPDNLITAKTIQESQRKTAGSLRHRRYSERQYVSPMTLESELQEEVISSGGFLGGVVDVQIDQSSREDIEDQIAAKLNRDLPAPQFDAFDTIADAVARLP